MSNQPPFEAQGPSGSEDKLQSPTILQMWKLRVLGQSAARKVSGRTKWKLRPPAKLSLPTIALPLQGRSLF